MTTTASRRYVIGGLIALLLWSGGIGVAYLSGFLYNPTDSMPIGLYRFSPPKGPLQRGQVVFICPEDNPIFRLARSRRYFGSHGLCKDGYQPFIKPVAAIPGDQVTVRKEAVLVNGKPLKNSALRPKDSKGRPMPLTQLGKHAVPPGYVWLISSYSPKSFDSRYWGPLPIRNVQGIATPVWVVRTEAP